MEEISRSRNTRLKLSNLPVRGTFWPTIFWHPLSTEVNIKNNCKGCNWSDIWQSWRSTHAYGVYMQHSWVAHQIRLHNGNDKSGTCGITTMFRAQAHSRLMVIALLLLYVKPKRLQTEQRHKRQGSDVMHLPCHSNIWEPCWVCHSSCLACFCVLPTAWPPPLPATV